jgi:hypothetical protein
MKDFMYWLIGIILIGLLCVAGYYGALRQWTKFKADMAFFNAILPWLAGSLATIAMIVVVYTLSIAARDRFRAWRKS